MDRSAVKEMVLSDVDPKTRAERARERRRGAFITSIEFIAIIVAIIIVFFVMIGISRVDGDSMYPTLHDNNIVLYRRHVAEYKPGDVVSIKMDDGELFVKRIIAGPGSTVVIDDGKVYVNGNSIKTKDAVGETEPIKGSKVTYPYKLKDGEYFVLGDNREVSDDSREFGAITVSQIKGRIVAYIGRL